MKQQPAVKVCVLETNTLFIRRLLAVWKLSPSFQVSLHSALIPQLASLFKTHSIRGSCLSKHLMKLDEGHRVCFAYWFKKNAILISRGSSVSMIPTGFQVKRKAHSMDFIHFPAHSILTIRLLSWAHVSVHVFGPVHQLTVLNFYYYLWNSW